MPILRAWFAGVLRVVRAPLLLAGLYLLTLLLAVPVGALMQRSLPPPETVDLVDPNDPPAPDLDWLDEVSTSVPGLARFLSPGIIGAAAPIIPIPAETFMHSTNHNNQNCGVLCALLRCTWRVAIILFVLLTDGFQPAGFQPVGGTRYPSEPKTINTAYTNAIATKVCQIPGCMTPFTSVVNVAISLVANGEPIIAPPPKPMIAIPVAIPRRSGNHLIKVETGEI